MNSDLLAFYTSLFSFVVAAAIFLYVFFKMRDREQESRKGKHDGLERHSHNPIITPGLEREWEVVGTFNPAALKDDNDEVHLLYRAIGADGISRLGYARSPDGMFIKEKSDYPVFAMRNPRGDGTGNAPAPVQQFDPVMYPSGGSWGGCEDPRMVRINGRVYVTFNAFDGWDFIRIGVISIDERKFFKKQWDWSEPFLISPPGTIAKNWVLFPEKINGKFAILHSLTPEVQVDYVTYLEELAQGRKAIKSKFGQKIPRKSWDTWVRGAGPPPVKTNKGWLVLYHAMDKRDPHIGYKIGAMLLDLNDPKKVIARSSEPILTPNHWYENDWKPGVVYACGAVVMGEKLRVYYGGGDKHVCAAETPLEPLLNWILEHGEKA